MSKMKNTTITKTYTTPQTTQNPTKTPEPRKELYKALQKALNELQNPKNTRENPFFKSHYAPLSQVLEEAKKVLSKHGLFIYQRVGSDIDETNRVWVGTVIAHENGEEIRSGKLYIPLPDKKPQTAGSAITYARRYSLMALLGVAGEEEDDDANRASHRARPGRPDRRIRKTEEGKADSLGVFQ